MTVALARLLRDQLIPSEGVKKHGPVRRASIIYSSESPSESIYFVESGYVKIVKKGAEGKEVLIGIVSPGQIFGEHAICFPGPRTSTAEMLADGVLYEISRALFLLFCRANPECWEMLTQVLLERSRDHEQKIGLLCLNDVESRILYYLSSLTSAFGLSAADGQEYSLPLSQSELASLVGATRETTSTTLNSLARRGVLKLGRRLVTVTSAEALRTALRDRGARAAQV
jgi:CRP-like cAMP-binding protein